MSAGSAARAAGRGWPLLLALLLAAAAHEMARAVEKHRPPRGEEAELLYFPNGPWVRPLTLGRERLVADWAWLEAIQYYGKHRESDRSYPYAEKLFFTLVGLDPGFEEGYIFGALVLADRAVSPAAARRLLRLGMWNNPESWRLPFEYGFLAFLEKKDAPEAARYLGRAGHMPGAPPTVLRLAAYAAGQAGERDLARELWKELLRSSENDEVKRIARRYLEELEGPARTPAARG